MAHVIGIPLLKGNSQVLVSCHMREGLQNDAFTGQAIGLQGNNSVEPNIVPLDDVSSKGFYGFIVEINDCSKRCTVVRAAESVALPSDGTAVGGSQVMVDPATGLISATGSIAVSGTVLNDGGGTLKAVNGKTGADVANPVLINLSVSPVFPVAPATASTKKAS